MTPASGPITEPVVGALLAAMARRPAASVAPVEASEYEWDVPCSFGTEEAAALAELANELAGAFTRSLGSLLAAPPEMASAGCQEAYGSQLAQLAGETVTYGVELVGEKDATAGLIEVALPGVSFLMAGLLGGAAGDAKEQAADVQLTTVQTDLLVEALEAMAQGLSKVLQSHGAAAMPCRAGLKKQPRLPEGESAREFCRMRFTMDPSQPGGLAVVIPSAVLKSACMAGKAVAGRPAEEVRKLMRQHVEGGVVRGTVYLGQTQAAVREILGLAEGDVLVLETGTQDPVAMVLNGTPVLAGMLVECEGHYGLRVTARVSPPKGGKDGSDRKG